MLKGSLYFDPISLHNLVLVVGIDFEGIPSVGFAAEIDLESNQFNAHYDSSLALFFDSGDPAKSLFAGAVSNIHMSDVLETIVGVITNGEDEPPDWLTSLFSNIAIEGTDHFSIPGSLDTALQKGELAKVAQAFNQAQTQLKFEFSQSTTLLVSGQKGDRTKTGYWYITDYGSDKIRHYQLVKKRNSIDVSLEAQLYLLHAARWRASHPGST